MIIAKERLGEGASTEELICLKIKPILFVKTIQGQMLQVEKQIDKAQCQVVVIELLIEFEVGTKQRHKAGFLFYWRGTQNVEENAV